MFLNQKNATSFLNRSARTIKGVMKDKDQMVKKNLRRCNFKEEDLENLRRLHIMADAADDRYVAVLKQGNPDVSGFESKLRTTFHAVEKHTDLLKLEMQDGPELDSIITLKKQHFFYQTDEAIDLAEEMYGYILSSGKAQLALQKRGVTIDEIRETATNVLNLQEERKQYIVRQPEVVSIERERQEAFVKLADALKELETAGIITLRGLTYKDGKDVLRDLGIPFLDMVLSNWFLPPDDKMVKDSSIT